LAVSIVGWLPYTSGFSPLDVVIEEVEEPFYGVVRVLVPFLSPVGGVEIDPGFLASKKIVPLVVEPRAVSGQVFAVLTVVTAGAGWVRALGDIASSFGVLCWCGARCIRRARVVASLGA